MKAKSSQQIRFNLTMNGWKNTLVLYIKATVNPQRFLENVEFYIIGLIDNAECTIDLEEGKIIVVTPYAGITVKPYDEDKGKDKVMDSFKIPKFELNQIRDYVSYVRQNKPVANPVNHETKQYTFEEILFWMNDYGSYVKANAKFMTPSKEDAKEYFKKFVDIVKK